MLWFSQVYAWGFTHAIIAADYGFEYSDEEVQEDDIDIENQYYNSKGRHCDVSAVSLLEEERGGIPGLALSMPLPQYVTCILQGSWKGQMTHRRHSRASRRW